MHPKTFRLSMLALAGGLLLGAATEPPAAAPLPWYWSLEIHLTSLELDPCPGPGLAAQVRPGGKTPRLAGTATVEVWGDGDRQETLRVFRAVMRPALAAAYDAGLHNSIGTQILSEIMAMGAGFHTPSVASVWYNAQRPVIDLDPVKLRLAAPFANVHVSASATRR